MRHYLTSIRMTTIKSLQIANVGEDMEGNLTPVYFGGNVHLLQPLWKTEWRFLRKLKTDLLYNLEILFLTQKFPIYLGKIKILTQKDTCTHNSSTIYKSQIMYTIQVFIN